jgi:hypothetical protein
MTNKRTRRLDNHQVALASEHLAAAQFARLGLRVMTQNLAGLPGYDLIVDGGQLYRVSVKGNGDNRGIMLTTKINGDYHGAIETWRKAQNPATVFCFVWLERAAISAMPPIYLATAEEVAAQLHLQRNGAGDGILHDNQTWVGGVGKGTTDALPAHWRFSQERWEEVAGAVDSGKSPAVRGERMEADMADDRSTIEPTAEGREEPWVEDGEAAIGHWQAHRCYRCGKDIHGRFALDHRDELVFFYCERCARATGKVPPGWPHKGPAPGGAGPEQA